MNNMASTGLPDEKRHAQLERCRVEGMEPTWILQQNHFLGYPCPLMNYYIASQKLALPPRAAPKLRPPERGGGGEFHHPCAVARPPFSLGRDGAVHLEA